jgi:phospholipid/cholesterol/gamma-HCH transport system substrate-binding protein
MLTLLLTQAKWLVAFGGVVALALFSYHGLVPGSVYTLNVPLSDASGLYPGSDVLIAGSRAGTVDRLTLKGDSVWVELAIDPAHAPVRSDASVILRPKSLLGEKYLDLLPGRSGFELDSGASIPAGKVSLSTDLQDVVNTFDQPTREKLQTVLVEVGGGVAGQGSPTNETIRVGTSDLNQLTDIANTLKARDAELEKILQALDDVLSALTQSDRQKQLGELIANTQALITNLANQDAELKRALAETNSALDRTGNALDGTQGNLADIVRTAPALVHTTDQLGGHLATGSGAVDATLPQALEGIRETAIVFGGHDANGYATRISVVIGPGSGQQGAAPSDSSTAAAATDGDLYSFLLGQAQTTGGQG